MAVEMEQQRAPELTVSQSESRLCMESSASMSLLSSMDETKPFAPGDVSKAVLVWPDPSVPRHKPTTPGGSSLKVETSLAVVRSMGSALDEAVLSKPSDGLQVPSMNCDSVSPVSPTVMKDLHFDSRFISDAWSYEAPQNMYALLTQPTHQMDPLTGGTGPVGPYMQQQQLHLQHHLEQHFDHLPLQLSPLHGSSFSSLYMSGGPLTLSPHQMMMHHQPSGNPNYATPSNLSDLLISSDPNGFLGPSGSPVPMPHGNSVVNVKDLTLNELRPHFNKPMAVVAKELGVCITLMKKICRRNGLVRWPHRRIRSLVNRITSLQVLASNAVGAECKRFHGQITTLREELSAVIQNPNEKSRKPQSDAKSAMGVGQLSAKDVLEIFPVTELTDELNGPKTEGQKDSKDKALDEQSQSTKSVQSEGKDLARVKRIKKDTTRDALQAKKRKPSFGLHAHQPPPIKISRHEELPSIRRLQSQSVPGRRLRGDRRHGCGREFSIGGCATSVRPSTTTHRNGRRGSISSILNGMPE